MYAYFSNTPGEFEAFTRSGVMLWPRGLHIINGKTPYQNQNKQEIKAEGKDDIIYLIVGSDIKDFKWETNNGQYQIKETPNLVFQGKVIEIIKHPVICYRFKPQNSKQEVNLPLEFFDYLKNWNNYLGGNLTQNDKNVINNIISLKNVIDGLIKCNKLEFVQYNQNKNAKYKKFLLDNNSKNIIHNELNVKHKGINWQQYLNKLDSWSQKEYVKVELNTNAPLLIHLDIDKLNQGISTRQLLYEELDYYNQLNEEEKSIYPKVVIKILEKIKDLEKEDKKRMNVGFINKNYKQIISNFLKINRQIVLTGAPGTGKTYMAKEICKELLACKLNKNKEDLTEEEIKKYIYFVQFHPSYDYTDFVEGLRPVKKGNEIGFERRDGIFMELCRKAKEDPDKNYYLIIDEINRADLSKVFGELMYCLEYRGEEGRLKTQYNNLMEEDHPFKEGFYVPANVYIIATMNDIDRSVEAFDFALRRRFFWYEIKANDVMEDVMKSMLGEKLEEELVNKLIESAKELNKTISDKGKDYGLNEHYHLGPAYFGKVDGLLEEDKTKSIDEKIKIIKDKIWKYRVEPILREYVRGYDGVDDFIENLRQIFFNNANKNSNFPEEDIGESS